MAEYIFRFLLSAAGLEGCVAVSSAAVSREELGNDMYPPAQRTLRGHGIAFDRHRAHQVTEEEMRRNDYVIIMDQSNAGRLHRLFGGKYMEKVRLLMSWAGAERDVADPWYTDDFETAYRDIEAGCIGLLAHLKRENQL